MNDHRSKNGFVYLKPDMHVIICTRNVWILVHTLFMRSVIISAYVIYIYFCKFFPKIHCHFEFASQHFFLSDQFRRTFHGTYSKYVWEAFICHWMYIWIVFHIILQLWFDLVSFRFEFNYQQTLKKTDF